jgi:hypothetical protein
MVGIALLGGGLYPKEGERNRYRPLSREPDTKQTPQNHRADVS